MIAPQFLSIALEQTANIREPEARRRAMREWLQDQGFSISAIKESDAAIRSAISFASQAHSGTKSQGKTTNSSHSRIAGAKQSSPPNLRQSPSGATKSRGRQTGQKKRHGRQDGQYASAIAGQPRKWLWASLIVLCAALGGAISLLLITPSNLGGELLDTLEILAFASCAVAAISLVFLLVSSAGAGRRRSAAFALLALPLWSIVILIFEAPRWSDRLFPPTALSERGLGIYADAIVALSGGDRVGPEVYFIRRFSFVQSAAGYCQSNEFWWATASLDLTACEVVDSAEMMRIRSWCDEPGRSGTSVLSPDGVVALLKYQIEPGDRDTWSKGAQLESNLFFNFRDLDFTELAARIAADGAVVSKETDDGETEFYTTRSTRRDVLVQSLERYGCSGEHIRVFRPVRPVRPVQQ